MTAEFDLDLGEGRILHVYDTRTGEIPVFWHHGTPNIGAPPRPLFRPGVRWISYDRPGYGSSTPSPGRDVASAAHYTARVAAELGLEHYVVMGHSGGGAHALACAALSPGSVQAVVSMASPAPYDAEGLDWFGGMTPSGVASLRAAARGREAKQAHEAVAEYDPEMFTPGDHAALDQDWAWVGSVVGPALDNGPGALIDDDLAYVAPWGFDPARIAVPALVLHGTQDRMIPSTHGRWLAERIPGALAREGAGDGHITILRSAPAALDWLRDNW
ncbi:MAG: alpha/beta fold hydrolase [Thermoactinospora sp.]|nr:alpha/beta fold hydrolase [Thermoactinospora sp.]